MEKLIKEYKETRIKVKKAIQQTKLLPKVDPINREQLRILQSMDRDISWSIHLMEQGQGKNFFTPLSHLAKERREISMDSNHFEYHECQSAFETEASILSVKDQVRLHRVLQILTPREREIYTLSRGQGFSYHQIATLLQVAKGTVQRTIFRVEKKIENKVKAMKQAELYQKTDLLNAME